MSDKIQDLEDIAQIISIAIARERSSVKYYRDAFMKSANESAKAMFSLLEKQEKGHEAKLRAQLLEIESELEMERMKKKTQSTD